jgi:ParB family transcriptional regulator, chromosome partitioning protein
MSYGLGRGLSSLIPPKTGKAQSIIKENEYRSASFVAVEGTALEVDPDNIEANPFQPRKVFNDSDIKDLSESIKIYGVIQPLIVVRQGDKYQLIAGERRLRASKLAGLKKVPVIVRDYDQQKKLEVALVENLQREDLNPIDTAHAYRQLMDDFNLSADEAGKKVGKSRSQVANSLRLLSLSDVIQTALLERKISEAHGIYLLGIESEARRLEIFRKIVQNNWTVKETSQQVRKLGGSKESRIKEDPNDKVREAAFRSFFGAKTEIKRANRGGKIIIDFYSDDDLIEMTKKIKD